MWGTLQTAWQSWVAAKRITADVPSCRQLRRDILLYYVTRLVNVPGMNRERVIRLHDGHTITYRLNRGDIWAIREMWMDEVYNVPGDIRPDILIDLGAHIGLASLWLAKKYSLKHIIAVEPSTTNIHLARRNLCDNGIEATVLEAAIGPADGFARFLEHPSATNGGVEFLSGAQSAEAIGTGAVRMVSMPTLLAMLPEKDAVVLVKMDIEGGEGKLLEGNPAWLEKIDALLGEFHVYLVDCDKLKTELEQQNLKCLFTGPPTPDIIRLFLRERVTQSS